MSTIIGSDYKNDSIEQTKNNNNLLIEIKNEFKIKSLYLAKSAHELKNVFLTICSYIENKDELKIQNNEFNKKKENEDKYILNFLKSLCDFGMNLIYEITQISKNEGKFKSMNKESLENDEFNLINSLNFCVKMFQSRAKFEKKNIEIKLNTNNISKDKKIKSISMFLQT